MAETLALTRNLDRIPASSIDEIKVINNPNARYDAEAEEQELLTSS